MHAARATHSRRGRFVPGAVLLLTILALLISLTRERNPGPGANAAVKHTPSATIPLAASAAEIARRAAIAHLGPIKRRQGLNAADLYKQAIGLFAQLTEAEKNIIRHPHDRKDPKVAAALHAKLQPIMDLLRNARKADYADWGLGPTTFENTTNKMTQYQTIQNLAALAIWDSNYRFQSDPAGAVGDLAATEALGASGVDSLIGLLVEQSVHTASLNLLAQNAGALAGGATPDLADIIDSAAVQQNFQTGLADDAAVLQAELDEFANPATRNGSLIQKSMNVRTANGALSPQEVISELQWLVQTEKTLGTTFEEPDAQFQQWWRQMQAQAASMPLANTAIQPLSDIRTRSLMMLAQNAMIEAGLALDENNQTLFQSIPDPATGQPFTYTRTPTGFQLGSAVQNHGKRVSLSFSTPAPK